MKKNWEEQKELFIFNLRTHLIFFSHSFSRKSVSQQNVMVEFKNKETSFLRHKQTNNREKEKKNEQMTKKSLMDFLFISLKCLCCAMLDKHKFLQKGTYFCYAWDDSKKVFFSEKKKFKTFSRLLLG